MIFKLGVFLLFINLTLEEMNIQEFLEQLRHINLEDGEKENQILSQKENSKRSSKQAAVQKLPFTERIFWGKSKKKITWILDKETQVPETS